MESSERRAGTGVGKCWVAVDQWEQLKHEHMESLGGGRDGRLRAGLVCLGRGRAAQ
ncbi:hypothetical protein NITLEN_10890 [Nitrospira lenta]|uniref:Uncharacterized protein n=1 Tax=Nitrospira lenta TaxID=1436998 RepID=A0A330L2D6_9BACT|nr:hypothetical protein NITLEN_10890 [Nitrospira lenta]